MVFSSISFLYYFLPIVFIIYFIFPKKLKNLVLFVSSMLFYFYGEPVYIFLIIVSIFSSYIHGLIIDNLKNQKYRKIAMISSVSISTVLLVFFKYTDFLILNINIIFQTKIGLLKLALPIGISFYTFQTISYVVDIYRKEAKAQRSFLKFATYISFFPQLIAGPIVRYIDIEKELNIRNSSFESISEGIKRFTIGLAKKVLIANNLGLLCEIFLSSNEKSVVFYWLYGVALSLQIYFDFSGYSDMAIGLGRIFGFHFPENFNYPYISKSITEFWRRWHITLGTWFRDYVYIPLGGNRVNKITFFRNIFIVWFLTGLWHGTNWTFIIWGLFFGFLLILEKLVLKNILEKLPTIFKRLYVCFCVMISFILFSSDNIKLAMEHILGLFGIGSISIINNDTIYYLKSYFCLLIISIIAATPIAKKVLKKLKEKSTLRKIINLIEPVFLCLLILISTGYLVDNSFNPFLYFRF